ncbi:MAG: type II toxin-antitoxin system VapC family toxin [Actinomycetota bacterium]|nr:type II toxin-antitoxin system VapC family toxin [Actinomycetota bacterium]
MILLDTHALLWWLAGGSSLSGETLSRIADRQTRVLVSAVSVFEIETKRRLGRLRAPQGVVAAATAEGFDLLVLDSVQAELAGALEWSHRDPFDRLLVAQSRLRAAPLLTADAHILDFEATAIPAC